MTPVIVALYADYAVAAKVRTQLVAEGLPTDRIELTSKAEAGDAAAEPGDSYWQKISNYFHTIFDQTGNDGVADQFADRVRNGGSVIVVHPRADYEMASARRILRSNDPQEFREETEKR